MSAVPFRLALVGNPNCGKTSLFNRLTGARAKVANYPGVTVERRSGMVSEIESPAELLDLPGTYSLFVTSPDEQVARDVILGQLAGERRPDLMVAVVDACNLRLGLRLVMELRSLNRPMVLALNQMDEARRRGISINTVALSQAIGVPISKLSRSIAGAFLNCARLWKPMPVCRLIHPVSKPSLSAIARNP